MNLKAEILSRHTLLYKTDVIDVFKQFNVYIPREVRMNSLREALYTELQSHYNELVKRTNENEKMTIRAVYRMARLKWYNYLTETQLEEELCTMDNAVKEIYLKLLWKNIIQFVLINDDAESIIDALSKLNSDENSMTSTNLRGINTAFNSLFFDQESNLDGIHVSDFRKYTYHTANVDELLLIGKKYGVHVTIAINKETLKQRLIDALKEKNVYDEQTAIHVEQETLKGVKDMLEKHGLSSRSYLNKEEVLEYILANAEQVKHLYDKPTEDFNYGISEDEEASVTSLFAEEPTQQVVVKSEVVEANVEKTSKENLRTNDQLDIIINQQKTIIELLQNNVNPTSDAPKTRLLDKVFNYIIFVMIIIVALIWIIYGLTNMF